jgi:isopenicillin N synthase-like dioxygenase
MKERRLCQNVLTDVFKGLKLENYFYHITFSSILVLFRVIRYSIKQPNLSKSPNCSFSSPHSDCLVVYMSFSCF